MIKVRSIDPSKISDCKLLQKMLNEGYVIIRADACGGIDYQYNHIIYILELK